MTEQELMQRLGFTEETKAAWIETNGRYYDDVQQAWIDKLHMHAFPKRSANVYVMPSYQSPITGKWIDTPSQRRDDLKRSGSRPWEGMEQEKKEAQRKRAEADKEMDTLAEKMAVQAWQSASSEVRAALS